MGGIPLPALAIRPPEQPDAMGSLSKLMAMKSAIGQQQLQQQQIQADQLENQQRQLTLKSQQGMQKAYIEANGDADQTMKLAPKYGVLPKDLLGLQNTFLDQKMKAADLVSKQGAIALQQADLGQGAHDTVMKADPKDRPAVYQQQMAGLQNAGVNTAQFPPQYPGDDQFKLMGAMVQGHKQQVEDAFKAQEAEQNKQKAALEAAQVPGAQAKSALEQQVTAGTKGGLTPQEQITTKQRQQELGIQGGKLAEEKRHNLSTEGQLTPDALTMASDQFAATGVMPQVGRTTGIRTQIINAAAAKHPGTDLAVNSAEYKSNVDSLKKAQTNFDQVNAFENTAGKNLDLFLTQAKKVVDSGSPWINRPLRMVAAGGLGSEDQAAFNAARQTALTEIAKVLSSSNATGGVVSDSARGEVNALIGPSATLKQVVSAANILKQDMANRHDSYQDQIKAIQDRIGKAKGAPNTSQQTTAPGTAATKTYQGHTYAQQGDGSWKLQ